jgi:hypothetical protein
MNAHAAPASIEVDPRLGFLLRAAVHHDRAAFGLETPEQAFEAIIEPFFEVMNALERGPAYCYVCGCSPCQNPTFCAICIEQDSKPRPKQPKRKPRPTPEVTIDAVMYCVRERGLSVLKEPDNLARLKTFDDAARERLNRFIAKLEGLST